MSQIDSDSEPVEYWSSSDESNSSVEIILDAPSNHASAQADPSNAQAGPSSRGITLATRQPARVPGSTAYPLGGWMNAPPVRMPRHNGTPPPPPPYLHPPTYSDPSAPPPVAGPPSGSPPPNYPSANAPPPAFLPAGGAGHAIPRRRPEGNILEAANREAERIKQYFDQNPRQFTFEGKIGNGMTGVSCQIKQRRRWYSTSSSTRFIVKRAIYPYQEPFLQNEIRTLRKLRGAQHIVQPFSIKRNRRNPLRDAPGPTVYMEMIENGSLRDFVVRARNWGYPIPNRLLLRFFMCLVQFCIAMAWPPKGRRGARPRRERIPGNEEERNRKYQMRHNDMHLRNILIGDIDPNDGRHDDVPILKLIDFDRAQLFADPEGQDLGVKWNIFEIGTIMRSLITQNLPLPPNPLDVVITLEDGTQRTINSYGGDINTVGYPNLDPELGMIVIQCMTTTVEQVPNLEDLYETIRNLNATRTGAYYQNYPRWQHETNDAMKRIVQALIMDADN